MARAKAWAKRAGIRAVTDITHLDCLDLPVFVSERDPALSDGFAFGKGRFAIEAEIGAHMEAIEHYFAEPGVAPVETRWGGEPAAPFHEFAPILNTEPREQLLLARAEDAATGAGAWIPAELVFCPAPEGCARLYGSTSNGLASGNSVAEASLHALFELIERDIWSIEFVRDASERVRGLPDDVQAIVERAARGGLTLVVRSVPSDYGLPFFAAFLFDERRPEQRFFNGGWGCHLDKHIALMRAVAEVAQSRCAYRHGGRAALEETGGDSVRAQIETVSRAVPGIVFDEIAELEAADTVEGQWEQAVACLGRVVDRPIYRVVYTPEAGPLHVVRLVVPLLENFSRETMRAGPRFQAELERA